LGGTPISIHSHETDADRVLAGLGDAILGDDLDLTKNISRITRLICRHGYYLRVTEDRVEGIKDENDQYSEYTGT